MDLLSNFTEFDDARLTEYADEVRAAFDAIVDLPDDTPPTAEQVAEAEGYAEHLEAIAAEQESRTQQATELASRREALRSRFAEEPDPDEPEAEVADEPEPEVVVEEETADMEPVPASANPVSAAVATRPRSTVATIAARSQRPAAPARSNRKPVTIVAAANTEFNAGEDLGEDFTKVNEAVLAKMLSFGAPNGDGTTEDLHKYPIAKFGLDFPEDLTIQQHSSDLEVLYHAADEKRLEGESLVAAAGWCAPSEVLYDLCQTESTDGIGSVPEVAVARGGIKYTSGPDFSSIYGAAGYFDFTEAQSIAGTGQSINKPCATVTCPTFTDTRLDGVGLCIKVEFLANQAYPELTQRFISGALIAQQHKVWLKVLNKMLTLATAKTWLAGAGSPDGSVLADSLDGLTLYSDQLRQKYKMPLGTSMELLLPYWLPDAIKADLSRRNGIPAEAVTDEFIVSLFRARKFNPQFVYGLPAGTATGGVDLALADVTGPPAQDADTWPTVYTALMYPAGTFVKGVADVVNLSAVYDAASLAANIYTGLFVEQGVLVAQLCPEAFKVQIPVCTAGRTGKADIDCA